MNIRDGGSWQTILWNSGLIIGSSTECIPHIQQIMQSRFPGKYTVDYAYIPERGVFGYKLIFDDFREQTMWMLRWS